MKAITLAAASEKPDNNFNLIRLLAAWVVIYGHSYAISAESGPDLVVRLLNFKFSGGIAVDVFFVISGFLIAASLERHRLPAFLLARALRILPALIVCVALCAFVLGPWLTTSAAYWHHAEVWRYFFDNARLARKMSYYLPGVFAAARNHAVNGSLWTLPIEARLYLWLALVGLLSLHRRLRFNLLFVLLMALGIWASLHAAPTPEKTDLAYCRAFFLTGAFAWINREAIPLSWPLLFAILVFAAGLHNTDWFYVGYFLALSYGTLFLAYVPELPVIRQHDLSYGLYLYGWPSQQIVQAIAPATGALANTLWATLLAGAFAAASWFLVEAPAMRLKSRLRIRSGTSAATPVSAPAAESKTPQDDRSGVR